MGFTPCLVDASMNEHHATAGGFRNPWPTANGLDKNAGDMLRWMLERWRNPRAPDPHPDEVPRADPRIARPVATPDELRTTFVGHASFLLQINGVNLLTDPVWSERASPVQWAGPRRFSPPGIDWRALPPIHAVLLSHDHYDHLDAETVHRLAKRFPHACWFTPLGYTGLLRELGVQHVRELDWWQSAGLHMDSAVVRIIATPAQHWTRRMGSKPNQRLWCSFVVQSNRGSIYFGGDSGFCPVFSEIGARYAPFDHVLLPIGAYEPRWFMKPAHMNPEEAVEAYRGLGNTGRFIGMHWGTFRLTDEPALEPLARIMQAWSAANLPDANLRMLAIGETLITPCRPDRHRIS